MEVCFVMGLRKLKGLFRRGLKFLIPYVYISFIKVKLMKILSSTNYIRFLNLAKAIRELTAFPSLNPMEECLLNYVALAWQTDNKLSVSATMHSDVAMSPSSVHRHLKSLRAKGYLCLVVDELDNRIKYITNTPLSAEYFSMLGQCISETVIS